jgi:ribosomal protein L27
MPASVEPEFFIFLKNTTAKDVTLYAIEEGSVVFPRYLQKFEIIFTKE